MKKMAKWMSVIPPFGLFLLMGFTQTMAQAAEISGVVTGAAVTDVNGTTPVKETMAATGSSLIVPGVVLAVLVVVAAIVGGISLFMRRRGGR